MEPMSSTYQKIDSFLSWYKGLCLVCYQRQKQGPVPGLLSATNTRPSAWFAMRDKYKALCLVCYQRQIQGPLPGLLSETNTRPSAWFAIRDKFGTLLHRAEQLVFQQAAANVSGIPQFTPQPGGNQENTQIKILTADVFLHNQICCLDFLTHFCPTVEPENYTTWSSRNLLTNLRLHVFQILISPLAQSMISDMTDNRWQILGAWKSVTSSWLHYDTLLDSSSSKNSFLTFLYEEPGGSQLLLQLLLRPDDSGRQLEVACFPSSTFSPSACAAYKFPAISPRTPNDGRPSLSYLRSGDSRQSNSFWQIVLDPYLGRVSPKL